MHIRPFPFDSTTTSSEDYKQWSLADPARSAKPSTGHIKSSLPFDGELILTLRLQLL